MVEDEDVIFLDDKGDPFPVFALLREVGGKLAAEANASLIPRLVNTVKALNGEVVVAILRRKAGLFVTGGGGVGKTQLLRQCVDEHRQLHGGSRVGLHVVAPTGVAAAAAGGVTIHSFLRLSAGCFNESLSEQQDAARLYSVMDAMSKRRLAETSLLLLDEVSMVSSQ
ncbi:hypothetical protein I4F81_005489 [Pyropia yezoensis]|uniref:Uncharacterized protein n=1 Tax=Pyropia yezoensis TaxID=2788 RepID=A0ACC3BZE7_PYRYE|nr:hypothetical protein I4F81_005489 [Neopyropia yezoensis]